MTPTNSFLLLWVYTSVQFGEDRRRNATVRVSTDGHAAAEIWRFLDFLDGGRPPSWIFKCGKFQLPVPFGGPICVIVPNFAKIGRTVPEMADFRFIEMAAAAILDFRNFRFLTIGTVKRVRLRLPANFCRKRSNRG